ncbi:DUF4136 domain-containing protein [Sphingomonas tabacisoli]|uniref:DUF4136 domain-containing protein n=1 Tax=Sphingomonas tabacisoli TaxID=2249466 RepID=A0ABW4I1W2_9SPHN
MSLPKKIITAFAPLSLIALGACAQGFDARVSRFQALPPPAQGQTFFVQARNPALQGGIEFGSYAQLVAQRLEQFGYRQATDPRGANLVVSLDYDVDHGHDRIETIPGWNSYGGFGGWGWGGGFGRPYFGRLGWRGGWYDPWLWGCGIGCGDEIRSYTVYQSQLRMEIDSTADNKRLFEGTAKALSRSDNLPYLVPNLIEAMFTGFPGNSGETVRITVPPPPKRRS